MTPEAMLVCVISLMDPQIPESRRCLASPTAREISGAIMEYTADTGVDPTVVAALIHKESLYNTKARGKLNELGLMQIKRNGAIPVKMGHRPDSYFFNIRTNIRIGVKYLAWLKTRCDGPTAHWLSKYNGRGCRTSIYSKRIYGILASAKRKAAATAQVAGTLAARPG